MVRYFLVIVVSILSCCCWLLPEVEGNLKRVSAILTDYTLNVVQSSHTFLFSCPSRTTQFEDDNWWRPTIEQLLSANRFVRLVKMNAGSTASLALSDIFKIQTHARTNLIIDCRCEGTQTILRQASDGRYFNKTYQWLLLESRSKCYDYLSQPEIEYFGPNTQIVMLRQEKTGFELWDLHTKGHHLGAPIEEHMIARAKYEGAAHEGYILQKVRELGDVQGILYRGQFRGLTLRGATVIDQDGIQTYEQINEILSRPSKDLGVAAFTKYHYEILRIARDRLNFTVLFRNARVWSGHLQNTSFRLGYLGIMKRNEADVGGSGTFNRLHRFVHFDILHSSWKFETAFLFLYTSDLMGQNNKGNFIIPFDYVVWLLILVSILATALIWYLIDYMQESQHLLEMDDGGDGLSVKEAKCTPSISIIPLRVIAALTQQGLDPVPIGIASRIVMLSWLLFCLMIYNYYTSSVVGGLLSNTARGPATVDEIIASPLILSFEDIGYHTVLFRESKSPLVLKLLKEKILPKRNAAELPVYSQLEVAIPFLRRGRHAFHCEVADAYPRIAQVLDAREICSLRAVSGLLDTERMNWIVHKNSQYTEILRNVATQFTEVGLVKRLVRERQPTKPECHGLTIVHPVAMPGIVSAFNMLGAGFTLAFMSLILEILIHFHQNRKKTGT